MAASSVRLFAAAAARLLDELHVAWFPGLTREQFDRRMQIEHPLRLSDGEA